jgi:hypothetical protein
VIEPDSDSSEIKVGLMPTKPFNVCTRLVWTFVFITPAAASLLADFSPITPPLDTEPLEPVFQYLIPISSTRLIDIANAKCFILLFIDM